MIKALNISKSIDYVKVLDNVSLDIVPGEILVVLGPSGAGKSTLLRNITLIDTPDEGDLSIDGRQYQFPLLAAGSTKKLVDKVKIIDREGLYPNITLVFQQFFLWPHLTVLENIELALNSKGEDGQVISICESFGILSLLGKYPNEISVGQKQKVSLVRALILKPKYLFLDEVTSALDVESTLFVLSYLKNIKEEGVAIVFITHALHIAQHIADKVIFMENGRIIEKGNRDILFKPQTERLKKFINSPLYT